VCLDGTWNTRDDSTNVLHHFALVEEGDVVDGHGQTVRQKKYYHEGVGTGVLDSISGGAFGFGLEDNVRDAYNWLVQHFQEATGAQKADEIYIFGFSRGAYTARSLVGFISSCGLLKRGAPLTVRQLWKEYCLLGRQREERSSVWDIFASPGPINMRGITELKADPWSKCDRSPIRLTDTERLMQQWSIRVRITYLGIYDTVGALGWDALAVPGLTSRLALHHNMRPTTLIQNCRHALAMDEHRASFMHTPFLQYVGHDADEDEMLHEGATSKTGTQWRRYQAMWRRKIKQCWFVGAHSNVGGGYSDNELAQIPFKWLFEGAAQATAFHKKGVQISNGLKSEPITFVSPVTNLKTRDSYEEFGRSFWSTILRAKRYYRVIDPRPRYCASRKAPNGLTRPGFSLTSINEQIDPSVFKYWKNVGKGHPPNLINYARRKLKETPLPANVTELTVVADERPKHTWLGDGKAAYSVLALWATFAAVGLGSMHDLINGNPDLCLPGWFLCIAAFGFVFVDWAESRVNFSLALNGSIPRSRAFFDSISWFRSLVFVLFVAGIAVSFGRWWLLGWKVGFERGIWDIMKQTVLRGIFLPIAACCGVVVANLVDRASVKRQEGAGLALLTAPLATIMGMLVLLSLGWLVARIFTPCFGIISLSSAVSTNDSSFAGFLLLLLIAAGYFIKALSWVGEPMMKANLDSIIKLQFCPTPSRAMKRLERWRSMLLCRWHESDKDKFDGPAAIALREILAESIWRDMIGFIPMCSFVIGLGLWFAGTQLDWIWLKTAWLGIPLWLLIPIIIFVANYVEDVCHLGYLHFHSIKRPPPTKLTTLSFTMTLVKTMTFTGAFLLVLGTIVGGSWQIAALAKHTGWRGTVVLLICVVAACGILLFLVAAIRSLFALKEDSKI